MWWASEIGHTNVRIVKYFVINAEMGDMSANIKANFITKTVGLALVILFPLLLL